MWKITYLGSGYYSIRPMYKLDMGLHSSSTYANIVPISTNDTLNNVGLANSWGIEYVNGGYVFKYVNSGSMALYPISAYDGATVISSTLLVFVLQKIYIFSCHILPSFIHIYDIILMEVSPMAQCIQH